MSFLSASLLFPPPPPLSLSLSLSLSPALSLFSDPLLQSHALWFIHTQNFSYCILSSSLESRNLYLSVSFCLCLSRSLSLSVTLSFSPPIYHFIYKILYLHSSPTALLQSRFKRQLFWVQPKTLSKLQQSLDSSRVGIGDSCHYVNAIISGQTEEITAVVFYCKVFVQVDHGIVHLLMKVGSLKRWKECT